MKVLKFGGSSVANAENIQKVVAIVKGNTESQIVVVSALGGVTDLLIKAGTLAEQSEEFYKEVLKQLETKHLDTARALLPVTHQSSCLSMIKQHFNELDEICNSVFYLKELSLRTKDRIISFGEMLSSKIIAAYMQSLGIAHEWLDSRKLIKTNSNFGFAAVNFSITNDKISYAVSSSGNQLFLAPGFISSDEQGNTTTLGRGGSDYTAAIFAAAVHATSLEIWTDVTGMMTADPRWVPNAKTIAATSYQEAMELSHFGAKVIYPPTIQPVMQKNIPTWVKNTFAPNEAGTVIGSSAAADEAEIITGISSINAIALLSLEGSGMVGIPGFSKRLFEALASEKINVILITQSSSEHSICVAVNTADSDKAKLAVDNAFEIEIAQGKLDPLKVEKDLSIIALVGDKMRHHTGIAGRMFDALGKNGVNIRAIAQGSSERNISAVIAGNDVKKAVNVLHEAFFETTYKQLNIFIIGAGNVGSKLIDQVKQQQPFLLEQLNLQVRVTGISNSKKMLFAENGNAIDLANWKASLDAADAMDLQAFVTTVIEKNLRNSVLVDVTANAGVAAVYGSLLAKTVSVVACNKIAASSSFESYLKLKSLAKEYNALFLFETNVGAGLPVIGTLNDLRRSGDKVIKIQAVLSGTLNFVFNNYNGTKPFTEVVRQAQAEGYTEPDPRLDLGGTDVMRKIMILAREAGEQIEMDDITNNGFLPQSCFEGTVEDFYSEMGRQESHFRKLYDEAAAKNCKLKFVAQFENGKASVGLQHIPADSDFYHLYGKDNIVLFYTQRYPEQPLVVKGAGAGADVTASGVFADIIRVARV
ncbi:bifunctional aspartate kinase/homoserine dehydrogenase I [Panacibacter sp. DH6]|uniref:Bifunctional aspartate kinase/homoserine dehydrogenase I n=1 Tax=Panacibacter microcysteis TaxID=2793269 RepID=A0A931GWB2_9BACT|nr:bifunctional aspartate kinase/homoserine dehydrogenase I [Panacibacter microcysteis]MBG9377425.1 bifunctional aspartate kinase/homoserine dehydrogenase I [Panacibacter microcysteis]